VETREELEAAYSDRTAMIFIFGDAAERGQFSVKDMAASGHARGVPSFVDAAAERPDAPNWYLEQGVDVVAYSGGKCLRGPQASGLVLGKKELLQAAFLNGCPHGSIGRPMKVGKEEVMALLAAVELFMEMDEDAVIAEWERRCATIAAVADEFDGISTTYTRPYENKFPPASPVQHLHFAAAAPLSATAAQQALENGQPAIWVGHGNDTLSFGPQTLQDGEAEIVADRLRQIFKEGH